MNIRILLPALALGALAALTGCTAATAGQAYPAGGSPTGVVPSTGPASSYVPAPAVVPTPPKPLEPHREISARDWALIAKSPDAHVGERIIVYGRVSQFDAITGPTAFRANIDAVRHEYAFEYNTNTVLRGQSTDQLGDVVQDDVIRAQVTVGGSFSYVTNFGGTLTVPVLDMDSIEVIG